MHPPAIRPTDFIRFGSSSSVASVIEFGDYECADCKIVNRVIQNVLPRYNGRIRFIWRDLPIEARHPKALEAAVFAQCAGEQSAFWEAHDALLAAENISEITFSTIARQLQLDTQALNACRHDATRIQRIRTEVEFAKSDGVSGAPLVFIGTTARYGAFSEQDLDQEIKKFIGN